MLAVTGLYTGILALIMVYLAFKTSSTRGKLKINLGTGDQPEMEKWVRAFGNFSEFVPMLVILLAVSELQGQEATYLHAFGIATVFARLTHAMGMVGAMKKPDGRFIGGLLTYVLILVGGGSLLFNAIMPMM